MKDTLAFRITALYRDFLSYTTGELKKLSLSYGQMPLILYAGKHPGCTQAELTRALRLDWGYSQRSIAKLADGGFLVKEYDAGKGGNCLHLTESGQQAFAVCHRVFAAWDGMKRAGLSDEEQETLLRLLDRLTVPPKKE